MDLARSQLADLAHALQVERLALRLFDDLAAVHQLGPAARQRLRAAAVLHDLGRIEGKSGHHKASLRLILESKLPPFTDRERRIVANVARYHRGALPAPTHAAFVALDGPARRQASILGGFVRAADGLDRAHRAAVAKLACRVHGDRILLHCTLRSALPLPPNRATDKMRLLEVALGHRVRIRCEHAASVATDGGRNADGSVAPVTAGRHHEKSVSFTV